MACHVNFFWKFKKNVYWKSPANWFCWICRHPDCVLCVNEGVTQELIDDTRLSTENQMLADLQSVVDNGGSLECRGEHGETPVSSYSL